MLGDTVMLADCGGEFHFCGTWYAYPANEPDLSWIREAHQRSEAVWKDVRAENEELADRILGLIDDYPGREEAFRQFAARVRSGEV